MSLAPACWGMRGCVVGWPSACRWCVQERASYRSLSIYHADDNVGVFLRTITLAFAFIFDWAALVMTLFRGGLRSRIAIQAHMIALLLVHLLRLHWFSFIPMWADVAYNLQWLAAVAFAGAFAQSQSGEDASARSFERRLERASWSRALGIWPALCFGGLLSLLYMFGSEHSVIPRWSDAAPETGMVVTIALAAGIAIGFEFSELTKSLLWFAFGSTGLAIFYILSPGATPTLAIVAVIGGAVAVMFAAAALPTAAHELQRTRWIGRSAFLIMLVVLANMLVSIWIVAYKFCPGGWLLRERHWVLLAVCWLSIAPMYCAGWSSSQRGERRRGSLMRVLLLALLCIGAPVVWLRVFRALTPVQPVVRKVGEPVNVAFWTIHFGYSNFARPTHYDLLQKLVTTNNPDIVAMLETDLSRPFFGNADIVEFLSNELGMFSDFGPATSVNTFGCALLSRFPIVTSQHFVLPSPKGELACMIVADLNLDPAVPPLRVVVSHFGNTEDVEDRALQTLALANLTRSTIQHNPAQPILVLAYLTTFTSGVNFKTILDAGLIDPVAAGMGLALSDPLYPGMNRYWEYILHNDKLFIPRTSIKEIPSPFSDTDLQVAQLVLTKD